MATIRQLALGVFHQLWKDLHSPNNRTRARAELYMANRGEDWIFWCSVLKIEACEKFAEVFSGLPESTFRTKYW